MGYVVKPVDPCDLYMSVEVMATPWRSVGHKVRRRYSVMRQTAKEVVCVAWCDNMAYAESCKDGTLGDWFEIRLG